MGMSATLPATEFSMGIMPRAARPSRTAAKHLELGAGQRLHRREDMPAGEVGIGPGAPWRRSGWVLLPAMLAASRDHRAGTLEIGRGVDLHAEPCRIDQAHRHRHPVLQGAQLLQPFALSSTPRVA